MRNKWKNQRSHYGNKFKTNLAVSARISQAGQTWRKIKNTLIKDDKIGTVVKRTLLYSLVGTVVQLCLIAISLSRTNNDKMQS